MIEISQSPLPAKYEEQAIDDYIQMIEQNAKRMKKEQLLETISLYFGSSTKGSNIK